MLGQGPVLLATAVAILAVSAASGSPYVDGPWYRVDPRRHDEKEIYSGSSETTDADGAVTEATSYSQTTDPGTEGETTYATPESETTEVISQSPASDDTYEIQTEELSPIYKGNVVENAITYLELKASGVRSYINEISTDKESADKISSYDRLILTFIFSLREGGGLFTKFILLLLDDVKPTDSDTFKENLKNTFSFPDLDIINTFEYLNSGKKCHGMPEHVIDSLFDFLEVTTQIKFDKSVLEFGLSRGYVHSIALLITRGSGGVTINDKGDTLLHYSAQIGNIDSVNMLLDDNVDVDAKNKEGLTPLYYAAMGEQLEVGRFLLTKGANVDSTDENGDSLLHIAARLDDLTAARALIELGAAVDSDNEGMTPLYRAAQFDNKNMMTLLRENGADIRFTKKGDELIHMAALYNHTTAMENILALGVDIETKGHSGFTPLHMAARSGLNEMVQLLLQHGANVDSTSSVERTPLFEAAFWCHFDVVETLIRNGANLNHEDVSGQMPIDMARMNDHVAMVNLLKSLDKNVKVIY